MRSKKRWTLAAAAALCLVALPAAAQSPGGKTKTKDTAASGGKTKTKTKAAPAGKTKTKAAPAGKTKTKAAPAGKTKAEAKAAPGGEVEAKPAGKAEAPAEIAPTDSAPVEEPAAAPGPTRGQALTTHIDRLARIDRIDALAKAGNNTALARKMSVLRAKERARHAKVMATLMSKTTRKADDAAKGAE